MLQLIDKLFKSDLVEYPNFIHFVTSIIVVIAVWVLSIMIFYYSLPVDTKSAAEHSIYDKAGVGFDEESKKIVGYYNTYYSFSKEQPQIVIYTDNEIISDSEIDKRAGEIFNETVIGSSKYNNGVLIYLSTKPDKKIRLEAGSGLEDVINDATAGRLIDSKIELIGKSKPLKDFSNKQLEMLSIFLFIDINKIIAKKYNIQFPTSKITSQIYYYKNQHIHILILITLLLILCVRCLKYRYVYVFTFLPFIVVDIILLFITPILYLIGKAVSIVQLDIPLFSGIIASLTGLSYVFFATFVVSFVIFLAMIPFLINILSYTAETDDALSEISSKGRKTNIERNNTSVMPYAKALLTDMFIPQRKIYYQNISHRFLLNYMFIFFSAYIYVLYLIDVYGYTIPIISLIFIVLVITVYLFFSYIPLHIPITYALYTSIMVALLLDFNLVYKVFFFLFLLIMLTFNLRLGIYKDSDVDYEISSIEDSDDSENDNSHGGAKR